MAAHLPFTKGSTHIGVWSLSPKLILSYLGPVALMRVVHFSCVLFMWCLVLHVSVFGGTRRHRSLRGRLTQTCQQWSPDIVFCIVAMNYVPVLQCFTDVTLVFTLSHTHITIGIFVLALSLSRSSTNVIKYNHWWTPSPLPPFFFSPLLACKLTWIAIGTSYRSPSGVQWFERRTRDSLVERSEGIRLCRALWLQWRFPHPLSIGISTTIGSRLVQEWQQHIVCR